MNSRDRVLAYVVLRTTVRSVFLFYGLGKLLNGFVKFAEGHEKDFSTTWLPGSAVYSFGVALPFLELIAGSLLVLGMFTRFAAAFGGILLLLLTTGLTISGNPGAVAHNLIYSIIFFLLLHHADDNGMSLDSMRAK